MSEVFVNGCGVVSPAGWGFAPFREALLRSEPLPVKELARPGQGKPLHVRLVPPGAKPAFLAHPRMRRASSITQFAAAAALEALGANVDQVVSGRMRLGIVLCVMTGCVGYSRRFFGEVLNDPATASPLIFPETVFNAPASHIAALLGASAISYTLVGDQGMFLQGLALAADWLLSRRLDACLVIGAEEIDWLSADAFHRFERKAVLSEGAGAVCLSLAPGSGVNIRLKAVTGAHSFTQALPRAVAAQAMRAELPEGTRETLLCDGLQGLPRLDAAELAAWRDWPGTRVSPKRILGESLAASGAWQCAAGWDALQSRQAREALLSIVGVNQQAIGAVFSVAGEKSD